MRKIIGLLVTVICVLFESCTNESFIHVTNVTLDSSQITLVEGKSCKLTAAVSPKDANNLKVIWTSSNASVAEVSDGTVRAVSVGQAQIKVVTDDGGLSAICNVTVVAEEIPLEKIKIDTELILDEKSTGRLNIVCTPEDHTDGPIKWSSSDEDVAVVTAGVVTALSAGETIVTASSSDGTVTAECKVTVLCHVQGVNFEVSSIPKRPLCEGDTVRLIANVWPARAAEKRVSWSSSDESVASVDDSGLVTALKAGKTSIIVKTKEGEYEAACDLEIVSNVAGLELDKENMEIFVGDADTLHARILPENATNQNVLWESTDENIATVTDGVVKGINVGECMICVTSKDGGYHRKCLVKVYNHVSSITLDKSELELGVGSVEQIRAAILPENAHIKDVIWHSEDSAIASVDTLGNVTAHSPGQTTVTATTVDGGLKAECKVTVKQPLRDIKVTPESTTLYEGQKDTLRLSIIPEDAQMPVYSWKVEEGCEEAVSVSRDGVVTAKKSGRAKVYAVTEDGKHSSYCDVTVKCHVSSVRFEKSDVQIGLNAQDILKVTVYPERADNKELDWSSSDNKIVMVDKTGTIAALRMGSAYIKAVSKDNPDAKDSCLVTVTSGTVLVSSVTVSPHTLTMNVGAKSSLSATVLPEGAEDRSLKWKSSAESVAVVSDDGLVTAVGVGEATITATAKDGSGKSDFCTVTVKKLVKSITLSTTSSMLEKGKYIDLTATITPSDAQNKELEWVSSSDAVATVTKTSSGARVTAVAQGSATITASAKDGSGVKATCSITVIDQIVRVTSVKINGEHNITLYVGESIALTATVNPSNATNQKIKWWKPAAASQVAVYSDGVVKACNAGTTWVFATSEEDETIEDHVTITVKNHPVEGVTLDKTAWPLKVGESVQLYATVLPSNATIKNVTWISDDSSIATVTDGKVVARKAGSATITVKTQEGSFKATCTINVTSGDPGTNEGAGFDSWN